MESYPFGQTATITMSFVDTNGDPANPTSGTLEIQKPDETIDAALLAEWTPVETGTFTYSSDRDQAGEWIWRVRGVIGATAVVDTDREWVYENPITATP